MNLATPPPTPERPLLTRIFLSSKEPRLRAGWRIVAHTIGYNLFLVCITSVALIPILVLRISPQNLWLSQIVAVLAVTLSVFLARRFVDRRSIASMGLSLDRQTMPDLLAGIAITFVMMGTVFGLELVAGWLSFEGFAWQSESLASVTIAVTETFLLFLLVAWQEELLFRGYRLQNIAEGTTPVWGVLLSSIWFGAAHVFNPHATIISTVGIFGAGIFLAYGYLRTGRLWLPIGLHIGWNFFEGVVFGFPVSGLDIYHLTHIEVHGPEWWTGGAFGPEAGLILLPALAIGAALIFIYTRQHNMTNKHHREFAPANKN